MAWHMLQLTGDGGISECKEMEKKREGEPGERGFEDTVSESGV